MIRFSNEEGIIKPKGIHWYDEENKVKLPEVAVGVFSRLLIEEIVQKYQCQIVGFQRCANFIKDVYILDYKGTKITLFMASVSSPHIAADLEELSKEGVKKFIIFGNCGVLDSTIEDCSIIIPTKAFREEGVSYHYIDSEEESIELNTKYIEDFKEILKKRDFDYREGFTWTTDAFYRETREKFEYYKNKGCICVEMEGSALAAVAKYLNLEVFTFYYAGDNLDSVEWDKRSLEGATNIDKKKLVTFLALDLAKKIKRN